MHQISKINDNSYSYVLSSDPGSSPTGTITSTFVALYGLSNVNGIVSTSRVYSDNQPISGWARKSSVTPVYKTGIIDDEVSSIDGMNTTAILIVDE